MRRWFNSSPRSAVRNTRGWIGLALAAAVGVAGAAVGAQASSSGSAPSAAGSAVAAGSSSANDPHDAAAQREADRILTTFQPPPGAAKAAHQPDPVPSGLQGPPIQSGAQTQAVSVAWYSTSQTPDQVLEWVQAHRPTGSSASGGGSGSTGPSFLTFSYATLDSSLIVTPQSGSDGRTIIRLDASVVWAPSRASGSKLGYGAPSVSVVTTNTLNPHNTLPATETRTVTATAPLVVHQIVDLLNALQPQIPGTRHCAMDDGTRVRITLPGLATVSADPGGCDDVTITPRGGTPQYYSGGTTLVTKVYSLFGITWSRTGGLPQGIERTEASGTP
jgi:hypothetical protein